VKHFRLAVCALMLLFFPGLVFGQAVSQVFVFSNANSSAGPLSVVPTQGRDGAIFGTTSGFGLSTTTDGTVFRIALTNKAFSALHQFSGSDGLYPESGLTLAGDGNYYGTTPSGGASNAGVLFKVSPGGAYSVLYQFTGATDGAYPVAQAILASDGNFYGTTNGGGDGFGVVYRYSPSSGSIATIFTFSSDQSMGYAIQAPLIQAVDGSLYGTAQSGGSNGCGTIFQITTSGTLLQLYSFPCGTGGGVPGGPLIQASDGNLYGTTETGGVTTPQCTSGCGTIFKMSGGAVSVLYSFSGKQSDGRFPGAGLVEATDGNLYGNTDEGGPSNFGTLYQISKGGQYKSLYAFSSKFGRFPSAGLLQHTNGKLYGLCFNGGAYGEGTLYSLNMGLSPFIALVRYTGRIGQPAQILGQGLTGSTAVTINGVAATTFKVVSDTYMTAVIPTGAATGPVVVTTATGTLTSNHSLRIVE
jgi:uncharacterized repeat protein (TIGR03803 family)